MKNKQLKQKCLEHWFKNYILATFDYFDYVHMGPEFCAFCCECAIIHCSGCPIRTKTGRQFCVNTPFGHASACLSKCERMSETVGAITFNINKDNLLKSIIQELKFLDSLKV